jgi:KDO2-lipid IV(A) lauroyltransferase
MTARSRVAERVEAAVLSGVVRALQWLPPVAASNFGGWLARSCGPWLPISRVADSNLRPALPELDAAGRARVIRGVWDNLGRNVAELPHLANFRQTDTGPGWEVEGTANIAQLRASGASALFFSGHFGNWELILPIAAALGLHASGFYRAASNVAVDRLIQSLRQRALAPGMTIFA